MGRKTEIDIDVARHIEARSSFASLLLKTPDFFEKVLPVTGNTAFEEVTCVGLYPEQHALYATIEIKRDSGYGGSLCEGPGGIEYVRFFADWNNDGDFTDAAEDLGVATVRVHDIAGPKPLVYAVALALTEKQALCFRAKPVAVRAVLMYNSLPPAGNPNPPIVWGNVLDAHVQPQTRHWLLGDLLQEAKLKLAPELVQLVDTEAVVSAPKALTAAETVAHYEKAKAGVPLHRILAPQLAEVTEAMSADASQANLPAVSAKLESLVGLELLEKFDLSDLIGSFLEADGDTTFEEVHCVGLHPDLSGVVAVLDVKKASGYSGGLCTSGSIEHVAFWADWDNSGSFDEYLGTAQVRVHDETMPAGGVQYAVFLPVDLAARRRPCHDSPVARIRAVLSWNTPPSTTSPFAAPTWGNSVDGLVQLPVGEPIVGQVPFISVVGGMAVTNIASTGFATGTAVMAGFTAQNSPFARMVSIAGHISNPPDLSAGQPPLTYGLKYRQDGDPTVYEIVNPFQVTLTRYSGGAWTQTQPTQSIDAATHRYTYREDLTYNGPGGDITFVEGFILGKWQTLGLADGRYEVWMEADIGGTAVESNHVWVYLDNTAPVANIDITGDPFTPQGTPVTGTFQATDDHLRSWGIGVLPGFPHAPSPSSGTGQILAGTPFTLSTAGATPGGYVLQLSVSDWSIVNSGFIGLWSGDSVGFCVEKP